MPSPASQTNDPGTLTQLLTQIEDGSTRIVDLTRVLCEDTPPIRLPDPEISPPPFRLIELARYDERGPDHYWNTMELAEHIGTHVDAPVHWLSGRDGQDISEIPLQRLIGPAVVIDRSAAAAEDPDTLLEIEHVHAWEAEHGPIPPRAWIVMRTGWDGLWRDQAAFFRRDSDGGPHWPGLSVACARYLSETDVLGLGVETVGTDAGISHHMDPPHPTHHYFLARGKATIANLANTDQLPAAGAVLVAAPLKIERGSAGPARVFALVP